MEPGGSQFHESFRDGLIAGYVFAATFFIVIFISYSAPTQLIKKRKYYKKHVQKEARQVRKLKIIKEKQKQARLIEKLQPVELIKKRIEINKVAWIPQMSFTELCNATNYFSMDRAIGMGMTGIMYKATLANGWFAAVKRLYISHLFNTQFELEILILGGYKHRNIVPLLGFCIGDEGRQRILVYEYMSNGKLSDWLIDNDTTRLGWHVVIKIALGVARGLSCLHNSLHMVHLRISSECILLDKNFEPRISNFGGAFFMTHDKNKNMGFEKDVYDFGTLLFELIRGKVFEQTNDCFTKGPFPTYTYPTNLFDDPSGFYDAIDESLYKRQFEDEVSALLRVACDCIHPFPNQRPAMLEVYSKMSNLWERGLCEDSANRSESVSTSISREDIFEIECL